MPTGPQRIILIRSGRYEYAEVDINAAIQIVGPNNTGKTTLINTLQFLYINDRRNMDFGSYTPEATREFYFPGQYSYILFECLGAQGACVIGWRGQSKTSGGEPERFYYLGPYDETDFLLPSRQIREPGDVAARLALKQFRLLKSAQEHAEILLTPSGGDSRGLGIVNLRDPEKYHQFRESLKALLTLSSITQEQMRDRLLMMAEIPPARTAINERTLFGDDYDRIRERRERLLRFKKNQPLVERLVDSFAQRQNLRGQLISQWTDLRSKRQGFEAAHDASLQTLRQQERDQADKHRVLEAELLDRRNELNLLSEQKGALSARLAEIKRLDKDFASFVEDLERTALNNLQNQIRSLELRLAGAQNETREKAGQKLKFYSDLVSQKEQTIAHFNRLAITALRKHFTEDELDSLFRLLNRDLLELPLGPDGIQSSGDTELLARLRTLLNRIQQGVYTDDTLTLRLPQKTSPLTGLENVETARAQLKDYRDTLQHWEAILQAIEQREQIQDELRKFRAQLEAANRRFFAFEQYQKTKAEEPRLTAELDALNKSFTTLNTRIQSLESQARAAADGEREARAAILKAEDEFSQVMNRFGECVFPEFDAPTQTVDDLPADFDAAIALYLRLQDKQAKLADETARLLVEAERCFGEEFHGEDDTQTVRLLGEELEALHDKEDALARDWNAHIHALKATFDRILKELQEIHSAKDHLNRSFARIQVSNLKSIKIVVIEQSDLVSWIKRLASFDPGGLFDRDTEREAALVNFRTKLQDNPVVRFADLFTLGVSVEGPDGRKHSYHDFRQIESHGTTIAIKVLFNLLLLKSQLKRDDCRVPFFLDEIQILDPANRHAILATARKLGFLPITAAPEAVSEVDALYFLQPRKGWIVLRNKHRLGVKLEPAAA